MAETAESVRHDEDQVLRSEIVRLNKIIESLMNRAERDMSGAGTSFCLFETTIQLEDQVRDRTRELETALREKEKINRALQHTKRQMEREIEQRKQLDERLRQRERYQRAVFDNFPFRVWLKDGEGRLLAVNEPFARACGQRQADALIGKTDLDVWSRDRAERYRAEDCAMLAHGVPMSAEELVEEDGKHVWLETYRSPVFLDGRIIGTVGFARDITRRHRVAEQLRRLATFQEQLLNAIPNPIFYKDANGVYQGCNDAFAAFLGRSRDEIVGHTVFDLTPNELAAHYHAQDLELISQGGVQCYEHSVCHADGSLREVIFQKATFSDETGAIAGLVGAMMDITPTKRYQEQLAREKSLLRALIDSIPDLIFFKDADGVYLGCNKAFSTLAGRAEAELMGKTDFDFGDFETARSFREKDKEILASGHPRRNEGCVSYADGRHVLLDTLTTPYYDADGRLLGLIGISRDITERKRVLQELQEAKDDAEAANRAKSVFLATMSHEIRTPLTSIIGFAEMLADPSAEVTTHCDAARTILRNGKHLLSIINDILDLSKIEAGQLGLESIPFSAVEVLWGIDSAIGALARDKGIAFRTVVDYPIPSKLVGDPTRWQQILLNLSGNAVKFTTHGGVTVTVAYDQASTMLECRVADTGIGISAQQMDKLFRPFAQADNSVTRKYGGTGLGLHLVGRLAENMGGQVTAVSEPGQGSEFKVCIVAPMADGAHLLSAAPELHDEAGTAVMLRPQHLAGRVLVAEDGPDNRKLIAAFLNKLGLELALAENGEQAVEQALSGNFDVVLMDIQMPVLDGVSATELLRAAGFERPIVALTANVMAEDVASYLRSGCTQCLAKPIDFLALARLLNELLKAGAAVAVPAIKGSELPGYAELKAGFETQLSDKLACLGAAVFEGNWAQARQLAHALAGTAGSFGYPALTSAARALERVLVNDQPEQARQVMQDMLQLTEIRAIGASQGNA